MTAQEFKNYYDDEKVAELSAAFDRVANPTHWKAPISAVIPAADAGLIAEAIEFFTATKADLVALASGAVHVSSIGYAAGPAGDH